MLTDRPSLGILLMLGFCIAAPLSDAIAKLIGDAVPLAVLVFARFAVQAALLLPLAGVLRLPLAIPQGLAPLVFVRTVLHVAGIALIYLALRFLPLADAIAIAYVMPFFVLLFGRIALGEDVGLARLLACIVGFAGTLLIVQPSFRDVGAPALLPLAVAAIFAAFMLITRRLSRDIGPLQLQAVNGVIGSALLLVILTLGAVLGVAELSPAWPSPGEWQLLVLIGVLGTVAHLLLTWSLRFAPAASLAPAQYMEIPFAVIIGLVLFGDLPNGVALAGIAIVVLAGLYIILRERTLARAGLRAVPQGPPSAPPAAE